MPQVEIILLFKSVADVRRLCWRLGGAVS